MIISGPIGVESPPSTYRWTVKHAEDNTVWERLDCLGADESACPIGGAIIGHYAADGTAVTQWVINAARVQCARSVRTITDPFTESPVGYGPSAGLMLSLLGILPTDNVSSLYSGRSTVNGVPADTFVSTNVDLGDRSVTITQFFYPQGWSFPGRPLPTGATPLSVRVDGWTGVPGEVRAAAVAFARHFD